MGLIMDAIVEICNKRVNDKPQWKTTTRTYTKPNQIKSINGGVNYMKNKYKWVIIDVTGDSWYHEILNVKTKVEAVEKLKERWSEMDEEDKKNCSAFFVAYMEANEDGEDYDFETADDANKYFIKG